MALVLGRTQRPACMASGGPSVALPTAPDLEAAQRYPNAVVSHWRAAVRPPDHCDAVLVKAIGVALRGQWGRGGVDQDHWS